MKANVVLVALLTCCCSCEQRPKPSARQSASIIQTAAGQEMVVIPAGEFTMGFTGGQPDEAPAHKVRVDSFLMDRNEVTQEMYEKLRLVNPSKIKGPKVPVHMMSWVLAARYCNARSKAEGLDPCYDEDNATCDFTRSGYRLPTEAEWEYACRAGVENNRGSTANPAMLRKYSWFADNSTGRPHEVAQKAPNAWGLYDMLGNVAEWCNDMYDKQYYRRSPAANPRGPDESAQYVARGGAYNSSAEMLTPSARLAENPGFSDACLAPETLGFRCVRKREQPLATPGNPPNVLAR